MWNDPVEKHGLKWKDAHGPMGDQQCSYFLGAKIKDPV